MSLGRGGRRATVSTKHISWTQKSLHRLLQINNVEISRTWEWFRFVGTLDCFKTNEDKRMKWFRMQKSLGIYRATVDGSEVPANHQLILYFFHLRRVSYIHTRWLALGFLVAINSIISHPSQTSVRSQQAGAPEAENVLGFVGMTFNGVSLFLKIFFQGSENVWEPQILMAVGSEILAFILM